MKTHFKKMQNPNYIGSWDLYDNNGNMKPLTVTVDKVAKETVHDGRGGSEECPVMYFKENYKPMVMNATNLKAVAKITGSNFIEEWNGFKIKIEVKKVKAFGEIHEALRITEKGVMLPELTPKHTKWASAKKSLQAKTITLEQLRKHFSINSENEQLLCK